MYTNRFISMLIAISLFAVVVLVVQKANATTSLAFNLDSATRSYTAWAKATKAETSTVDSATRSYIAQAKAVACGVDSTYSPDLDSATRSYIAWGEALRPQASACLGALSTSTG